MHKTANKENNWPAKTAPLGNLAPRSRYCCGFRRKLTNSMISILASSHPATSLNATSMSLLLINFAVASVKLVGRPNWKNLYGKKYLNGNGWNSGHSAPSRRSSSPHGGIKLTSNKLNKDFHSLQNKNTCFKKWKVVIHTAHPPGPK